MRNLEEFVTTTVILSPKTGSEPRGMTALRAANSYSDESAKMKVKIQIDRRIMVTKAQEARLLEPWPLTQNFFTKLKHQDSQVF